MSNQTKHTPGPWHVARSPKYGEPFVTDSTGKLSITGSIGPRCIYAAKANARLIAAAPELLAACRHALGCFQESEAEQTPMNWATAESVVKRLTDTISKAEGRAE